MACQHLGVVMLDRVCLHLEVSVSRRRLLQDGDVADASPPRLWVRAAAHRPYGAPLEPF